MKIIIAAALVLVAGTAFGQTMQKGSVISLHVFTVNLEPDVIMNQYLDLLINKWIPELEKHFPDTKAFAMKGDRGEYENGYAMLWYFKSLEARDKYFDAEGYHTDEGEAAWEKSRLTREELNKLGTLSTKYTEWVIL